MTNPVKLDRRAVLKGIGGVTLVLPVLEAMGDEVATQIRGASVRSTRPTACRLPNPKHGIDEWSWFPATEGREFEFGKSTEPLQRSANSSAFWAGCIIRTEPRPTRTSARTCG